MTPVGDPERLRAVARRAVGFLSEAEGDTLSALGERAARSGAGPLVEIGAYQGRSTLFLAAGLAEALRSGAPSTLLFSVDHHHGSEEMQAGWPAHDPALVDPATGRMDSLPAFRRNIELAGAEEIVVAIVGTSAAVAWCWARPLSLVFIDGGHGAEPAFADYRGWAPHVAEGCLLAFHDVFEDPNDGGRPPYDCYRAALESGEFVEDVASACGSLRVLQRIAPPAAGVGAAAPHSAERAGPPASASTASTTAAAE